MRVSLLVGGGKNESFSFGGEGGNLRTRMTREYLQRDRERETEGRTDRQE